MKTDIVQELNSYATDEQWPLPLRAVLRRAADTIMVLRAELDHTLDEEDCGCDE